MPEMEAAAGGEFIGTPRHPGQLHEKRGAWTWVLKGTPHCRSCVSCDCPDIFLQHDFYVILWNTFYYVVLVLQSFTAAHGSFMWAFLICQDERR